MRSTSIASRSNQVSQHFVGKLQAAGLPLKWLAMVAAVLLAVLIVADALWIIVNVVL